MHDECCKEARAMKDHGGILNARVQDGSPPNDAAMGGGKSREDHARERELEDRLRRIEDRLAASP